MKKHISTINTKYIHKNNIIAISKLYIDATSSEFTIKHSDDHIVNGLTNEAADIYYFSVYIWNINKYRNIIPKLKARLPNSTIVLGGPECSYNPLDLIKEITGVDYIFCGEINDSINNLEESKHVVSKKSTSFEVNYNHVMHSNTYLKHIEIDEHQILYVETSKGCPFKCSYCMSSLEPKVIAKTTEEIDELINFIKKTPSKTIKFLDRTFNISFKTLSYIITKLEEINRLDQIYQFEVSPELLDSETLLFLSNIKSRNIRFEIGVQSIHDVTTKAVDRTGSFKDYVENIRYLLHKTNITLHIDLIAGLPYETYNKFIDSYNAIITLQPHEFQLGVLKLLHGTKIRRNKELHNYKFEANPPYTILSNTYISSNELENIHNVEEITDRFYNSSKFKKTFESIITNSKNCFETFLHMYQYFKDNSFNFISYQNYDIYNIMYKYMQIYFSKYSDNVIFDYLSFSKTKGKRFYKKIDKKELHSMYEEYLKDIFERNYFYKYIWVEVINNQIICKDMSKNKIISIPKKR